MPSDEHLVTIVGLVGIIILVVAGLVVLAVIPDTSAAVIPVVSVGVTALGALSRRQPATQTEMVAAAKQGADESNAGTATPDKPLE